MVGCKAVGTSLLNVQAGNVTVAQWEKIVADVVQAKKENAPKTDPRFAAPVGKYVVSEDCKVISPMAANVAIGATTAGSTINAKRTIVEADPLSRAPGAFLGIGDAPTVRGAASMTPQFPARKLNSTTDTGVRATFTPWPA